MFFRSVKRLAVIVPSVGIGYAIRANSDSSFFSTMPDAFKAIYHRTASEYYLKKIEVNNAIEDAKSEFNKELNREFKPR